MKKLFIFIICIFASIKMSGQVLEREKPTNVTIQHRICFYGRYVINKDGLYYYKECEDNVVTPNDYYKLSEGNERFFGYDKDYNRYYFYTNNIIGYYSPTKSVNIKDFKKRIIDNKVPIFSIEDVPQIKNIAKSILDKVYNKKNDSINEGRRIVLEKQREKKIRDSIEAVNRKAEKQNEYKKNHTWHDLTLDYAVSVNCGFCNDRHYERELYVISLSSDTIYYLQNRPDMYMLGKAFSGMHYGKMPDQMKQCNAFKEYVEMWRDSIALHNNLSNSEARNVNVYRYLQYKAEIAKEAPYGFIESWGWELNSADGIEPHFSFYNTSQKTIKYVDFYFNLYNAVGDKCYLKYDKSYTGHVRGVGPVEKDSSGSWEWDRATHYTTGDASEMRIVKVVITYMDKTVKTLTGNAIKYN